MSTPSPEEQKVWVQPGATGRGMMADKNNTNNKNDNNNINDSNDSNNSNSDNGHTHASSNASMVNNDNRSSEKEAWDHEAYSGLEVVAGGGPQIISREAPEVAAAAYHRQPPFAEQKSWAGEQPSPQVATPSEPEAVLYHGHGHGHGGGSSPPPPGSAVRPLLTGSTVGNNNNNNNNNNDHQYNGGKNPFESDSEKGRPETICGLRKKMFWVVLAIAVFCVMVAIAVGLGLGLGERNNDSSSSPSTSTSTAASTTLPAAVATATATSNTTILCPSANRTLYELDTPTATKKYLVLCGRDYSSQDGAFDITQMNVTTFEGCLSECGSTDGCIAVGWGNYYGTNTCWLKSGIGEPNQSDDWYAAVEDSSG